MAGNYRLVMNQSDIVKLLTSTVSSFIQDRLNNNEQRNLHKEQCAERLAAEDGSGGKSVEVRYSDQAVLANLDWGIDALEEAINTSNLETKMARLGYAEKMLQVSAMLNTDQTTAGVTNFYLSAWAHLNLSYLWKLRGEVYDSVLHVLDMFIIDPFFSRVDFAPELWRDLFLPQMSSIVGWYSEARHKLMMEVIPDSSDLSFTADLDQFFNESLIFSMRPDQIEKLKQLEQVYGDTLDENTRLFAKYYKDCISSDSDSTKKMMPMLPIAEPPMTPLHEVHQSIPDYVKFGPILPRSAGFLPVLRSKHKMRESARHEAIMEKREDDSDYGHGDAYLESDRKSEKLISISSINATQRDGTQKNTDKRSGRYKSTTMLAKAKSNTVSSNMFSPAESPETPPKTSSSNPDKNRQTPVLRLVSNRAMVSTTSNSLPASPPMINDSNISSSDSDGEITEKTDNRRHDDRNTSFDNVNNQVLDNCSVIESDDGYQSYISLPISEMSSASRPPKDFVCPITSQLFNDPVTLETGQTYERKAIQEWLERGNKTCPITRQALFTTSLPKTNYVLKRLITSWMEQHPDLAHEFSYSETPKNSFSSSSVKDSSSPFSTLQGLHEFGSRRNIDSHVHQKKTRFSRATVLTSPTSVISQATIETIISGLKPYILCLCTSDNLQECEEAVLAIAKLWKDSNGDSRIHSYLTTPTAINGFIEILLVSLNRQVLRASVHILSELMYVDESVGETLTSVDSDFDCLAALLKNGLLEAAILVYQLRPTYAQLSVHDLIPSLLQLIQHEVEEPNELQSAMDPKDAAIALLEKILVGGDENSRCIGALTVISANAIPVLVKNLDREEGKKSIVSILLCCMRADKSCQNMIASRIELSPVLELFHCENDSVRGLCVEFLSRLVQLNRRMFSNQILQIIKDEGSFSTMHTLLVYLQMAPMEQQPDTAILLLQLDLLVEPRKMSIYREEALEALIETLHTKDFSSSQMTALEALIALSGRLTSFGNSYMEAWLLKMAGFHQPYNATMKANQLNNGENDKTELMDDEEKAITCWERKVAFVLCNHEHGSIFKGLEECFKSSSLEIAKSCLVLSTWLISMLLVLPDTGVRDVARKFLLHEFINILQSSRNIEDKLLATLGLKTFTSDSAALEEMGTYAKCIYKTLRKMKKTSPIINDVLKSLMNLPSVNATELWNCSEVTEFESCENGEVLSLINLMGCVISSHSDGTIKVWDGTKKFLRLVQEVREHTKAVTCLHVPLSGDKLYSGSLDKTIRVWTIKRDEIHCVQVHEVKEPIYELTADAKLACYVSQGTGVKVYNWSGAPKHINFHKQVKCLAMMGDKVYCGCSAYSIQEVDLCKFSSNVFYSGTRKLLGKQTIQSLFIHDDLLFAGGSVVDGNAGKVFSLSTKVVKGSLETGFDISQIVVNNDYIFTVTKFGIIEVWLKERLNRFACIKLSNGGHNKITTITSDMDGGMLYAGSSDGKIQVWSLD